MGQFAVMTALVLVSVAVAAYANPGKNVAADAIRRLSAGDRTATALVFSAGLCGALSGMAIASPGLTRRSRVIAVLCYAGSIVGFSSLVLKDAIGRLLPDPQASGSEAVIVERSSLPGFITSPVADLQIVPTSIAIGPGGDVFVAGYSGMALQNGIVVKVSTSDKTRSVKKVADYLNRPHGIAYYSGDLYVSRSGQFSRSSGGKIVQENTGSVTRLRDIDEDGVYDYYEDIVTALPGAQQPDGLHQNNGIAFGRDGNLYITVGAPSDHGPATHQLAGTILRAQPDGSDLTVFAKGFRNPYDLTFSPDGKLFCTDNDAEAGPAGDEVNHVVEGKHYGHPYTTARSLQVSGVTDPILKCSSAQGIVYAPAGSLPRGFDECLYVAAYGDDRINRVALDRSGDTFRGELSFFANIPGVIDLAIAPDGVMYACSASDRTLYEIRPIE
jgi:glucose/arabinose dehydrogenase